MTLEEVRKEDDRFTEPQGYHRQPGTSRPAGLRFDHRVAEFS